MATHCKVNNEELHDDHYINSERKFTPAELLIDMNRFMHSPTWKQRIRQDCDNVPPGVRILWNDSPEEHVKTEAGCGQMLAFSSNVVVRLWPYNEKIAKIAASKEYFNYEPTENEFISACAYAMDELDSEKMWYVTLRDLSKQKTFQKNPVNEGVNIKDFSEITRTSGGSNAEPLRRQSSSSSSSGKKVRAEHDRRIVLFYQLVRLWKWMRFMYYYQNMRYVSDYCLEVVCFTAIFRQYNYTRSRWKNGHTNPYATRFNTVTKEENLSIWGAFVKTMAIFLSPQFLDIENTILDPCSYKVSGYKQRPLFYEGNVTNKAHILEHLFEKPMVMMMSRCMSFLIVIR